MKQIPLTQDKFAFVDDEDFDLVNQYKWHLLQGRYAAAKKGNIRMHRLIMKAQSRQEIDHINNNGLDNRRFNLRFCTRTQNQANKRPQKNKKSYYKGVTKDKNSWRARIRINYKLIHLGCFQSEVYAAMIYNQAAIEYFGEFACLNSV